MTKIQALAWVHTQIRANELSDMRADIVERCGFIKNEVHVYKGLATLAKALELPVELEMRDADAYPVRLSFEYNGYKFFQMERELEGATDFCDT